MQMFRSEWLRATSTPGDGQARAMRFGSRYGVRVERAPSRRPSPPMHEAEVPSAERERAVLQYMAWIDRAA